MNHKLTFTLVALLLQITLFATAKHTILRGTITGADDNLPLIGASIRAAGASIGTTSDEMGRFTLKITDEVTQLKASYIGYESRTITLAEVEQQAIQITLTPSAVDLNQVTVSGAAEGLGTITKIDVNLRPISNAQEVLRAVPGLFIAQHAGGGKAEQIFLRGFDIDHGTDISISVDEMPVNMVSHAHGQGYADLHFLMPDLIHTVDFGKGPYYANSGDFTTAGYVKFQTKNRLDKSMIRLEGGRFNTQRATALVSVLDKKTTAGHQSVYVAGDYLRSDGPFESPQNFDRLNLFAKYYGQLSPTTILSGQVSTFTSEWLASGQIPQRAVDSGLIGRFGAIDDTEGGNTARTNASLKLVKTLASNANWSNQIWYSNYQFELFSNFTFFLEDPTNGDQIRQRESRNLFGYNSRFHQHYSLGTGSLSSTIGAGFRSDYSRDNELSSTLNRTTTLRRMAYGDVEQLNAFAFANEDFAFGKWRINAGLRLDYFNFSYVDYLQEQTEKQSDNQLFVSPKLNLFYQANPATQFYFKTGIGFHSNDSRVVVSDKTLPTLPAAYGTDIGTIFKPTDRLLLNAALWYLQLEQEFVYVGDAGIVEPSGRTRRMGVDFSARYQLTDWLFADLDMTYTYARSIDDAVGENLIPLAPKFTSIGGLTFQHESGVNGSLRYRLLGDRPANEVNSVTAWGYTVLDATLNYTQPRYEIGLSIENLLNVDWNEAQFDTESRLFDEPDAVSELHFTPGTPFFIKGRVSYFF
ncbi:MAG: TonB-dependent receptor [Bacteroidota bacterium]